MLRKGKGDYVLVLRKKGEKGFGLVVEGASALRVLCRAVGRELGLSARGVEALHGALTAKRPRGYWDDEKDAYLRKHYQSKGPALIALILTTKYQQPITKNAVIGRWNRIKDKNHVTSRSAWHIAHRSAAQSDQEPRLNTFARASAVASLTALMVSALWAMNAGAKNGCAGMFTVPSSRKRP